MKVFMYLIMKLFFCKVYYVNIKYGNIMYSNVFTILTKKYWIEKKFINDLAYSKNNFRYNVVKIMLLINVL